MSETDLNIVDPCQCMGAPLTGDRATIVRESGSRASATCRRCGFRFVFHTEVPA